jgi:hypothetical protein
MREYIRCFAKAGVIFRHGTVESRSPRRDVPRLMSPPCLSDFVT